MAIDPGTSCKELLKAGKLVLSYYEAVSKAVQYLAAQVIERKRKARKIQQY